MTREMKKRDVITILVEDFFRNIVDIFWFYVKYFGNSTDTPLTATPSIALPSRSPTCPVKYCFAVKASPLFHWASHPTEGTLTYLPFNSK